MSPPFMLGWEEWIALPDLGLPAIKAKIDTGARTSTLHATAIEPIGTPERPQVRFNVAPIPGRPEVTITCVADVIDTRDITSSNGETERRFVIATQVRMGERQWTIEVTLTNREAMAYRMLLGRQAIGENTTVDPNTSLLQPVLSYRSYAERFKLGEARSRPLTIAILSRRPENAGNRRLIRQGELRGHAVSVIDRRRVSLFVAHHDPAILVNGLPLQNVDAVIFRAGRSPSAFSLAICRQLEMMGAYAINPAHALATSGDNLVLRQTLAAAGIAVPEIAVNPNDANRKDFVAEHRLADTTSVLRLGVAYRFAVVGFRALAVIRRNPTRPLELEAEWQKADMHDPALAALRLTAEKAARTISLGLVAVDVVSTKVEPLIVGMSANVPITSFDRLTGSGLSEAIIGHIEQSCAEPPQAPDGTSLSDAARSA
ncbi:MAG: RimK/LysX family protein [Hyphomicrobiaceae bacterium]